MGLKVDNGLTASLDVQAGLPIQTGYIEDSDWLNMDAAHTKTHFSRHENHTEQALLLDARLGWSLPLARGFSLEPFAQFGFMHFKFTARDGYLQYPPETAPPYTPWSSSISQVAVYGTGIAYQQEWLIPAIGVLVGVRLGDRASMSASFSFSPLVSCFDLDNHFLRSLDFYESMTGGLLFEPRLLFAWRLAERVSLSADISYRLITGAMGVSYEVATGVAGTAYTDGSTTWHAGDWWSVPNGGGSAFSAAKALIMLSVTP
jgi:outer membrane protease